MGTSVTTKSSEDLLNYALFTGSTGFRLAEPSNVELQTGKQTSGTISSTPTSLVAQVVIPGAEPNQSFSSAEEAERYIRRILVEQVDDPDSDGDVAFVFRSGDRFYVYGPDNLERFGDPESPLGLDRLGPAYANRLGAARAALGDDATFVSGGIIINGHFHKMTRSNDGYLMLGRPTRNP